MAKIIEMSDQAKANAADTAAATKLLNTMVELLQDEFRSLPSRRSKLIFCQMVHERFAAKLDPKPACVASSPQQPKQSPAKAVSTSPAVDPDVETALEICSQIEYLASEVPSAGEDFASDVVDRMSEVRATIDETGHVTKGQMRALENWEYGLSKWIRD